MAELVGRIARVFRFAPPEPAGGLKWSIFLMRGEPCCILASSIWVACSESPSCTAVCPWVCTSFHFLLFGLVRFQWVVFLAWPFCSGSCRCVFLALFSGHSSSWFFVVTTIAPYVFCSSLTCRWSFSGCSCTYGWFSRGLSIGLRTSCATSRKRYL